MAAESAKHVHGLIAFPIPTPDGELRALVEKYAHELGRAGGEAILWRPIGNPRSTDKIYCRQRTTEMEVADQRAAERFDNGVAQAGSPRHYIGGEYAQAIECFGLQRRKLPLILFLAGPPVNKQAILCLDDRLFERRATRQALADILLRELSEHRILAFATRGAITASSMRQIQGHLGHVRRLTAKLVKGAESKSAPAQRAGNSRRSSRGRPDPSVSTVGKMWLLKNGTLMFAAYTNDKEDGRVRFGSRSGHPTLGRQLFLHLSQVNGFRATVRDIASSVYSDRPLRGEGRANRTGPLGLVRTLVSDTRKKLAKAGINPAIISGLGAGVTYESIVELRLQHLVQPGDNDPGDPRLLPNLPDGFDENTLPTVDPEDSI